MDDISTQANISFNRIRRRRALKYLAAIGSGAGPVSLVR